MKEETRAPAKHEFEHAEPIVIHHPDEDMTILARWLRRGMDQGPKFWVLLGGVVVAAVLISVLATGLSRGKSTTSRAWSELAFAQTPGQKVEIAETFVDGETAQIAKVQAAGEYFFQAIKDLPNNRESALPQLKKALDLYQQVAKGAPKDSQVALAATFGAARTLEARNELPEAIAEYKAVVAGWPGSAEAKKAAALASHLQDPEIVAFYKELYTYKAPAAPSPSSTSGLPAGHPALTGPTVAAPPLTSIPPLPPGLDFTRPMTNGPGANPVGPGPLDIAPPPSTPGTAPKAAPSTIPEPKPASKVEAKGELPTDPFAPPAKATPKP